MEVTKKSMSDGPLCEKGYMMPFFGAVLLHKRKDAINCT